VRRTPEPTDTATYRQLPIGVEAVADRWAISRQHPSREGRRLVPWACFARTSKATHLNVYSSEDLEGVADELNDRPCKRLAFKKPIERIKPCLLC
jgi:hypothetical protein